jgi:hypothetical protein
MLTNILIVHKIFFIKSVVLEGLFYDSYGEKDRENLNAFFYWRARERERQ